MQVEKERLVELAPKDKAVEYHSQVSGLANQAQSMENELKFSKVVDFTEQAQTFYDAEILK